jgi:hypothetical protein
LISSSSNKAKLFRFSSIAFLSSLFRLSAFFIVPFRFAFLRYLKNTQFLAFSAFFLFFLVFRHVATKLVFSSFSGVSGRCPVSPLYCVYFGPPCSLSACLAVAVCYRGALSLFQGLRFVALGPARLRVSNGCALPRFVALSVCFRVARLSRGLPGPSADLRGLGRFVQVF